MRRLCLETSAIGQLVGHALNFYSLVAVRFSCKLSSFLHLCSGKVYETLSSYGNRHLEGELDGLRSVSRDLHFAGMPFQEVEGLPSARLHSPNDVFCEADT